jgi:hypothetical protein
MFAGISKLNDLFRLCSNYVRVLDSIFLIAVTAALSDNIIES